MIRVLQRVGVRGVPPDHQVGVGAQSGDVVPAADHQVVVLGGTVDRLQRGIRGLVRRVVQLANSV